MTGLTAPADNFAPQGERIEADGWFPGIETGTIRAAVRIGQGSVTDERLRSAVEGAIISALRQMHEWRSVRAADGYPDLESVTEQTLNGKNMAVVIWERMIRFYTAAEIADGHIDVSATEEALDREEEKGDVAAKYRRMAYEAAADLRAIGADPDDSDTEFETGRNRIALI